MDFASHNAGYWLQQAVNAALLACLYVTLASAYALLQGITNRIILSFGDFATFGAFASVYAALWALLDGQDGMVIMALALLSGLTAAAGLGRVSHGLVFAPIGRASGASQKSNSQAVMIASIGVSIVLQELLRLQSVGRDQWLPPLYDDTVVLLAGDFSVRMTVPQIVVLLTVLTAMAALLLAMRYSVAGRLWRAVSQNPLLAQLSGVDTSRVLAGTFVTASLFAAIAGWIVAVSYGGVSFAMGLVLGFKAMFASIIGGFGSIGGAVAGGVFLAVLETLWTATLPMNYRDVAVFAIIIAMLILKPEGLLGNAERRESEMKLSHAIAVLALLVPLLAACKDDADTPYVEFAGGGFVFNYRTANHYYGFVVRPKKTLPEGGTLEAHFEVPGGSEQVVAQPVKPGQLQYMFQTGDLDGIVKDHPYKATLKVLDGTGGKELATYAKTFSAPVDEKMFPKEPLVVGPGYEQPKKP